MKKGPSEMDGPRRETVFGCLADHPHKRASPRPVRPWKWVAWWCAERIGVMIHNVNSVLAKRQGLATCTGLVDHSAVCDQKPLLGGSWRYPGHRLTRCGFAARPARQFVLLLPSRSGSACLS